MGRYGLALNCTIVPERILGGGSAISPTEAECRTVNCTEGGILFGDPIEIATLEEFVHG